MSDYEEFDKRSVLNNIMIIDELFKANGAIHKVCSDMQENNETDRDEFYNGFTFTRNPDVYSFYLYAKNFLLKVENKTIFYFSGDFGVQFRPTHSSTIEQFKQLLLIVINMNSEQKFDNIEQFIDLHNMIYI